MMIKSVLKGIAMMLLYVGFPYLNYKYGGMDSLVIYIVLFGGYELGTYYHREFGGL